MRRRRRWARWTSRWTSRSRASTCQQVTRRGCAGGHEVRPRGAGWWVYYRWWGGGVVRIPFADRKPTVLSSRCPVVFDALSPPLVDARSSLSLPPHQPRAPHRLPPTAAGSRPCCSRDHTPAPHQVGVCIRDLSASLFQSVNIAVVWFDPLQANNSRFSCKKTVCEGHKLQIHP